MRYEVFLAPTIIISNMFTNSEVVLIKRWIKEDENVGLEQKKFDFRIINFAIFNIADSFVCIGVGMFALYIILDEIKQSKLKKEAILVSDEVSEETVEVEETVEEANYEENDAQADN